MYYLFYEIRMNEQGTFDIYHNNEKVNHLPYGTQYHAKLWIDFVYYSQRVDEDCDISDE